MLSTLCKSIVIKLHVLSRIAQCKYVCGESWTLRKHVYTSV